MPAALAGTKRRRWAIYDLFTCRDGRQIFIGLASDSQWRRCCSVLGMEDLVADPRLQTDEGRKLEREWLVARIAAAVAGRESLELAEALVQADVTVAPVHTPLSVLEDLHVASARRTLPAQIGPTAGRLPALPYESDAWEFSLRREAPAEPGAQTKDVLLELGYASSEVEDLARKGVVRGPGLPGGGGGPPGEGP
jgi:crotonobetainyl-CoA:carnitine CoA-transferase CaiB-like acyl-CoA transferase